MGLLTQVVAEQIARHGDAVAVGGSRGHLTYTGLGELSSQLGGRLVELLDGGLLDGGARIGIYAGNSPDYIALYLAVLRTGAVPFLMDPAMGAVELEAIASSCGIQAIVRDRHLPEGVRSTRTDQLGPFHLDRLVPGDAPDLLPTTEVCRFTSGSTGMPNCIEFSGTTVLNAARGWVQATSLEAGERILCFAGLFNGLAFNTSLLPAFLAGASLWLPSGLPTSGQVARFVEETRPTRLTGFPALYESLLRRESAIPGLADLRVALSSAAPLKVETLTALREKHSLVVSNYYGIAETGPLTFDPAPPLDNGLGYPLPGVEFAWRDAGSRVLSVRSPSMGSRYLNVPGGFEARLDDAGFYRTGDEGELRDGRIFLHGRWTTAINIGGRKVDAAEVRNVLLSCAGVDDAAVFSAEKPNGDPMLVAAVTGSAVPAVDRLRAHCGQGLAAYKVPERLLVLDELPRTTLGKVRMAALRDLVTAGEPAVAGETVGAGRTELGRS